MHLAHDVSTLHPRTLHKARRTQRPASGTQPGVDTLSAMVRTVRIFLSSPGDVATERAKLRDLLLGLARGPFVRGRVHIDVVSWDDPQAPAQMDARFTPQLSLLVQIASLHSQ